MGSIAGRFGEHLEAPQVVRLGVRRGLRLDPQHVARRRAAEEVHRFRLPEPRELGRLEVGAGAVGLLDQLLHQRRRPRGQAEADVDRRLEARRFFGQAPKLSPTIEREYLVPWPAQLAEQRYLDRFAKAVRA